MTKRTIKYFDWAGIANLKTLDINSLAPFNFPANASWALPQICATLGSGLPLAKNGTGKYDFALSLARIKEKTEGITDANGQHFPLLEVAGMIRLLRANPRGLIFPAKVSQYADTRWCAGVPLILSALKEFRNIKYSDWDWVSESSVAKATNWMDSDIAALIPYFGKDLPFDTEDILDFRARALRVQSSKSGITHRSLRAASKISTMGDDAFDQLPRLLKMMLLQTWVYLPEYRNQYMITDINNLDGQPPELVSTDIFNASPASSSNPLDLL